MFENSIFISNDIQIEVFYPKRTELELLLCVMGGFDFFEKTYRTEDKSHQTTQEIHFLKNYFDPNNFNVVKSDDIFALQIYFPKFTVEKKIDLTMRYLYLLGPLL